MGGKWEVAGDEAMEAHEKVLEHYAKGHTR